MLVFVTQIPAIISLDGKFIFKTKYSGHIFNEIKKNFVSWGIKCYYCNVIKSYAQVLKGDIYIGAAFRPNIPPQSSAFIWIVKTARNGVFSGIIDGTDIIMECSKLYNTFLIVWPDPHPHVVFVPLVLAPHKKYVTTSNTPCIIFSIFTLSISDIRRNKL